MIAKFFLSKLVRHFYSSFCSQPKIGTFNNVRCVFILQDVQKKSRYANSDMIFEIPIKNGVYGENLNALAHKGALQPLEKNSGNPKIPL